MPITPAKRSEYPRNCATENCKNRIVLVLYRLEHSIDKAVARNKPHQDTSKEDDRTCLFNERPCALPHTAQHSANCRNMISRKLHNEWCSITSKKAGLFQDDARTKNCSETQEVCRRSDPPGATKNSRCKQCNNRHLCTTRNKGCRHDGHTTIVLILDCTGSHNTRNATTSTNQNWNKRFTRQAKTTEYTIENKGDTGHISAGFKNCQQEEQYQHLRNEAQHRTNTSNYTIKNQCL